MGYMRHHAILVTNFSEDAAEKARIKAAEIFGQDAASNILTDNINGYSSFFVRPDGSKEGWGPSNQGDENRSDYQRWLKENGGSWAVVMYGDEAGSAAIDAHSGQFRYEDDEERGSVRTVTFSEDELTHLKALVLADNRRAHDIAYSSKKYNEGVTKTAHDECSHTVGIMEKLQ